MPEYKESWSHSNGSRYLSEFIGTFFLVFTVGCNVLTGSVGAAISIGAMLMVMIYALGSVSGAHFNPAVTLAILLSGRDIISVRDAVCYMVWQLLGGLCAGFTYWGVCGGTFALAPVGKYSVLSVCIVEALYTMALCYVVLNVATTARQEGNHYFGLAIGFTVVSAALAIGGISCCCLNPAVAFGTLIVAGIRSSWIGRSAMNVDLFIFFPVLEYTPTSPLVWLSLYFFIPFVGSVLAWGAFRLVRREDEYGPK